MEAIIQTLFQFLGLLFWSMFPFLFLVKIAETGKGFAKLLSAICLASGVGQMLLTLSRFVQVDKLYWALSLGGVIVLILSFLFLSDEKDQALKNTLFISVFTLLGLNFYFFRSTSMIEMSFWLSKFLLFGVLNFAMILGHYYLVVPRLSEKPLLHSHYISWLGLALSLVISIYSLVQLDLEFGFQNLTDIIFICMRMLWGYLAVGIISYFSFRLSQMRSTQSATGVLYVIVFFLIVGELLSMYFFVTKGTFI